MPTSPCLNTSTSHLSDRDLIAEVARLAACARETTASLIAHLAELYGRRLHERAGYSSLFIYCTDVLRLSEHEASDRTKSAKLARRYPAVLALLGSGRLNLTSVRLIAPHLTRRNHAELIEAAGGKSKRQLQELLARRFPRPDVPTSVRKLPSPRVPEAVAVPIDAGTIPAVPSPAGSAPLVLPASPRPPVLPLAPDRYQVTFTASAETRETLELAQDLLRQCDPERRSRADLRPGSRRARRGPGQAQVRRDLTTASPPGPGGRLAEHPGRGPTDRVHP